MASIVFSVHLFLVLLLSTKVRSESDSFETSDDSSVQRRLYSNPYHPEDDNINDALTEEDGDNLHDLRFGQLSDTEQRVLDVKHLKVNGRFFDIRNNDNKKNAE